MLEHFNHITQCLYNDECSQEELDKLSGHDSKLIREYVAKSLNVSQETILKLSDDNSDDVLIRLIHNPNTGRDIIEKIKQRGKIVEECNDLLKEV